MHKFTLLFALVVVGLSGALGFTLWQLQAAGDGGGPSALSGIAGLRFGLAKDEPPQVGITFDAESVLLWDVETQRIRFGQNEFARRPIASLTKLMTAMVAIDLGMDWEKEMTIEPNEYGLGGNLFLHSGERVTMRDLFHASLVGSANNATLAMVRGLEVPSEEFIREMNRKAVAFGLEQTTFVDVTGLDSDNVSTAYEVARMAEVAFREYPAIAEAARQPEYSFTVIGSDRGHTIRNTNKLISERGEKTTGTKTGYLDEALWCLVMKGSDELGGRIAVILGHPSERRHFDDTLRLLRLPVP